MLTSKNFGQYGFGRLGNQLFQYAGLIGLSRKYNTKLVLPQWDMSHYFKGEYPAGWIETDLEIHEPSFHYDGRFWDSVDWNRNVDITKSWFQSEKNFEHCTDYVRSQLAFQEWLIGLTNLKLESKGLFTDKPVIGVHLRLGDYVDNPDYVNLGARYYLQTLEKYFDLSEYQVRIFSDEPVSCRRDFGQFQIIEGNSAIEDLCLMSQSDHFVIANSSFSWWASFLGEKPGTQIIYPPVDFSGQLKERCNTKDLYPKRWTKSEIFP